MGRQPESTFCCFLKTVRSCDSDILYPFIMTVAGLTQANISVVEWLGIVHTTDVPDLEFISRSIARAIEVAIPQRDPNRSGHPPRRDPMD